MFNLKTESVSTNTDLSKLLLDAAGYRKSYIIMAGVEYDIFSVLSTLHDPTAARIADALGLSERAIQHLLGGLVASDLLIFDGEHYFNTPTAQTYLVQKSDLYLGASIKTLFDMGINTWSTLIDNIKKNTPLAKNRTAEPQAEFWQKLVQSIRPLSVKVAENVARSLQWKQSTIKRVLDIGGGSGVFGKAFLDQYPDCVVHQVDWPHVNVVARQFNGNDKRFITTDGDIFIVPWEDQGPYDVVVISHIVHQEPKERINALLSRVKKCLSDDGLIIINEYCLNREKNFPPYSLIFGLSMVLQNEGGTVYSFLELEEMLAQIGHEVLMINSPEPPSSVVISRKKVQAHAVQEIDYTPIAPRSFLSRKWDTVDKEILEKWVMSLYQKQIIHARQTSAFWQSRLADVPTRVFTRADVESIPAFTKNDLRSVDPTELLDSKQQSFYIVRGSGGTTGVPTTIFWSKRDWQAAIDTAIRNIQPFVNFENMRIWNGYNQGHISGPAFDDIIRGLGATPIPRHFKSSDEDAIEEMERLKVNALVLTPKSGSGKGGSLEDFLSKDPNFLSRLKIKTLFVSSTRLEKDVLLELKELGVQNIFNLYGSTEAMPTAISCPADPTAFHICQGHIFLEVVDRNGKHVKSGESGLVVVSKIGSSDGHGLNPIEGTQLFRYVVGDTATYIDEPCACKLHSARIKNITRLPNEEKIVGGCEKWD